MSLSILVRENSAVNLSMASIARLLLETVRSDQTEHNNNHPIKSQAVDIVEAPGEEGRVGGGVVAQLDEEQHCEQGEGQNLGDNSGGEIFMTIRTCGINLLTISQVMTRQVSCLTCFCILTCRLR